MTLHLWRTIFAATLVGWGPNAHANPLCASPEQQAAIGAAFTAAPKSSPAQLARSLGLAEATVVHGLPLDLRLAIAMSEFERLWLALTEWDDALVIVLSSGSVFELFGPLPTGTSARGYFNFDAPDSPYGGHLKTERLAAIYLLSTFGRNGETYQVAFYDRDGRRVFSVYVPRDEDGRLQAEPHKHFLELKKEFARTDLPSSQSGGCLWSTETPDVPGPDQG